MARRRLVVLTWLVAASRGLRPLPSGVVHPVRRSPRLGSRVATERVHLVVVPPRRGARLAASAKATAAEGTAIGDAAAAASATPRTPRRRTSTTTSGAASKTSKKKPAAATTTKKKPRSPAGSSSPPPPEQEAADEPPFVVVGAGSRNNAASTQYDASQITVLEFPENVRRRPGMYLGSSGTKGLHHMVWEILDNAVDEAMGGHASKVELSLLPNGACRVVDDGRGIPCNIHPSTGVSALETVLCVLHAGGKFGGDASGYGVAGGLHGVGLSVVNALSERLDVEVRRDGRRYSMAFERGVKAADLTSAPAEAEAASSSKGTTVTFVPDDTIFSTVALDSDVLARRLDELAYLNAGLRLTLVDARKAGPADAQAAADVVVKAPSKSKKKKTDPKNATVTTEFCHEGGIAEYADVMVHGKNPLHERLGPGTGVKKSARQYGALIAGARIEVGVECALRWSADQYDDVVVSFVNGIRTNDGGVHVDGLRSVVTRTVNSCAKKSGKLKGDNLPGDYVREGLTAVLSVKVPNAEFEGQTKSRLGSPGVRPVVEGIVGDALTELFERHPKALAAIVEKALAAKAAATAAKAARDLVRRKTVLVSTVLPGKLADCSSKQREDTELFIVEGDSAAGPAKQARERRTQAILPLRGKILNVEKCAADKIYANAEIQAMIAALGLGVKGEPFDEAKLRYGRVIVMTDADVDGAHIRSLILTFFFRYQRELVERGRVYIARPPLFKIDFSARGKSSQWDFADASAGPSSPLDDALPELPGSEEALGVADDAEDDDEAPEEAPPPPEETPSSAAKKTPGKQHKPKRKKGIVYCWSDEELASILKEHAASGATRKPTIQRFKGLGEMMANQLWDTTMDPDRRRLMRVDVDDAAQADRIVSLLMGDQVAERKEFIMSKSTDLDEDELDF